MSTAHLPEGRTCRDCKAFSVCARTQPPDATLCQFREGRFELNYLRTALVAARNRALELGRVRPGDAHAAAIALVERYPSSHVSARYTASSAEALLALAARSECECELAAVPSDRLAEVFQSAIEEAW